MAHENPSNIQHGFLDIAGGDGAAKKPPKKSAAKKGKKPPPKKAKAAQMLLNGRDVDDANYNSSDSHSYISGRRRGAQVEHSEKENVRNEERKTESTKTNLDEERKADADDEADDDQSLESWFTREKQRRSLVADLLRIGKSSNDSVEDGVRQAILRVGLL